MSMKKQYSLRRWNSATVHKENRAIYEWIWLHYMLSPTTASSRTRQIHTSHTACTVTYHIQVPLLFNFIAGAGKALIRSVKQQAPVCSLLFHTVVLNTETADTGYCEAMCAPEH